MKRGLIASWLGLIIILSSVVIVIEIAPRVEAPMIIYVDDSNLGFEDGSIAYPFNTIQEGVDAASNGDTVYVFNGRYVENVEILNKSINLIGEDKETTIIDGGGAGDVIYAISYWDFSKSVNVSGFTITNSDMNSDHSGIEFDEIDNCKIIDNIVTNNRFGLEIAVGDHINLTENIVSNNSRGIYFRQCSNFNITDNTVLNNNECGMYMSQVDSGVIKGNTVDSNEGSGIVISLGSSQIKIIDNDLSSDDGWDGIRIYDSSQINIVDNHISHHKWHGIRLSDSIECTLTNNTMLKDGIIIFGDYLEYWNTHNIATSNTIDGKPIYYWKNQTGGSIPSGGGQAILANCTDVTVDGQEFNYGDVGIELGFSSNCSIKGNNVSSNDAYGLYAYSSYGNSIFDNDASNIPGRGISFELSDGNYITGNRVTSNGWYGIFLDKANNNKITGNIVSSNDFYGIYFRGMNDGIEVGSNYNELMLNIISNNTYGIYLHEDSTNNSIYYNHIIDNTIQAYDDRWDNFWDNGYPSGGNYWSDYTGIDLNSTPSQDVPPPDGIGDTPYIIDFDSQDNYPLMDPYVNYMLLYEGWNLISIPLILLNTNVEAVLSSISGLYDAVRWYNVTDTSDPWKHNHTSKPEHLNDLNDIEHTMGFWIHITEPGGTLFEYSGTQLTQNQTVPLHPGWNLVGYPSLSNRIRADALNNVDFGSDVDAIWTYKPSARKWVEIGPTDHFELCRGYWVHSKVNITWDVPL